MVLDAEVDNAQTSVYTPAQQTAAYGIDETSNVAELGEPPTISSTGSGPPTIEIQMANEHEWPDGSVFTGFVNVTLPNAFLQAMFGINDPQTLTSAGVTASIGTGTATVTDDPTQQVLNVSVTGITFSTQTLKITAGTITPTTPTKVAVRRTSATTARVSFTRSKPRGSNVTGYLVRCASGAHVAKATGRGSPITVKGVRASRSYRCTVTADSAAGASSRSTTARLAASRGKHR